MHAKLVKNKSFSNPKLSRQLRTFEASPHHIEIRQVKLLGLATLTNFNLIIFLYDAFIIVNYQKLQIETFRI